MLAEKKKKKAKAGWEKLQLGLKLGLGRMMVGKGDSGAPQEEAADGDKEPATKGKAGGLKASLQKLIDRRKAQQAAQR